jgi:hypothetical protein
VAGAFFVFNALVAWLLYRIRKTQAIRYASQPGSGPAGPPLR